MSNLLHFILNILWNFHPIQLFNLGSVAYAILNPDSFRNYLNLP